jgi:hypothetical protein
VEQYVVQAFGPPPKTIWGLIGLKILATSKAGDCERNELMQLKFAEV